MMKTRRDFLKSAVAAPILSTLPGSAGSETIGAVRDDPASQMIYAGEPMSYWLDQLDSTEHDLNYEDIDGPGVFPSFGDAAIPHLIEALGRQYPSLATAQLQCMANPQAVRLLTDAVENQNWRVRAGAIRALLGIARTKDDEPQITELLKDVLPVIARMKWSKNRHIARLAETFVYKIGPALEPRCPLPRPYLDSEDASKRELGVRWLRKFRSRTEETIPLLETKLEDADDLVRWAAAETLSGFDPDHPGIAPVFLEGILCGRFTYLGGFQALDRLVLNVLPALQEALRSEKPKIRASVLNALRWTESESVLPWILEMLSDPSPQVRCEAVLSLHSFATRDIVPFMIEALLDRDRRVRQQARRFVRTWASVSEEVLPALLRLAEMAHPEARVAAMLAIADLGQAAARALPAIQGNLKHSDARVRMTADVICGRLVSIADEGVSSLACQNSLRHEVIEEDIDLLVELGPDLDMVVRALVRNLNSDRDRRGSVRLLELLGTRAKPAVPHLIELLKNPELDSCVRYAIQRCLAIAGPDTIQPLLQLLADDAVYVRNRAIHTLGLITGEAEVVVPTLLRIVDSGTPPERVLAVEALGSIGPEAASAVPVLRVLLRDKDLAIRTKAIEALQAMEEKAVSAVEELVAMLDERSLSGHVKRCVIWALSNIRPDSVPVLSRFLDHPDREVRDCVAQVLRSIGDDEQEEQFSLVRHLLRCNSQGRTRGTASLGAIVANATPPGERPPKLVDDPREAALRATQAWKRTKGRC